MIACSAVPDVVYVGDAGSTPIDGGPTPDVGVMTEGGADVAKDVSQEASTCVPMPNVFICCGNYPCFNCVDAADCAVCQTKRATDCTPSEVCCKKGGSTVDCRSENSCR